MIRPILLSLLLAAAPALAGEGVVYPPGSRIGLVPPDDMIVAKGLTGFRSPRSGAAILTVEMPADAYVGLASGFSPEALKAQGFTLRDRDAPKVGNAAAIQVTGEQAEGGKAIPKSVLLAWDASMTALVIGQLPPGASPEDVAKVEAALKTVSFRPALTLDEQIAALPFDVANRAGFRIIRTMAGNAMLLTDGPADAIREASQPMLILAESFTAPPPAASRDAFARQALVSNTFLRDATVERSQGFRQRGSDWHEIVAKAQDAASGVPVTVMQTIRFEPDGYVRAVGIVRTEQRDDVLPRFRQIVDSIAPR